MVCSSSCVVEHQLGKPQHPVMVTLCSTRSRSSGGSSRGVRPTVSTVTHSPQQQQLCQCWQWVSGPAARPVYKPLLDGAAAAAAAALLVHIQHQGGGPP